MAVIRLRLNLLVLCAVFLFIVSVAVAEEHLAFLTVLEGGVGQWFLAGATELLSEYLHDLNI